MLQTLRDHAGAWFVKLLFAVLVASFSLWGIGDVIRNYGLSRPVLQVNGYSVGLDEFIHALRQAQSQEQIKANGKLSQEQLKQMNLHEKVLEQFSHHGLIREITHDLGFVASDATVTKELHRIPTFRGDNGRFDPQRFRQLLQSNNMNEARFLSDLRHGIAQEQLTQPILKAHYLPQSYLEKLFQGLHQEQNFAYVEIPLSKMKVDANTDDAVLKLYYDQHPEEFARPESRSLSVLMIDTDEMKKNFQISDDKLKAEYDEHKQDYVIPEQRDIVEIEIRDPEQSQAALKMHKDGMSFDVIAKTLGAKPKEIKGLTRTDLAPDVADKIFAPQNSATMAEPLVTSIGIQIYLIKRIQPEQHKPFEEVKGDLLKTVRDRDVNELYADLRNKIEDALAAGSSMDDVAKSLKISLIKAPFVLANGLDEHGKQALPEHMLTDMRLKILEAAFKEAEGRDTPFTDLGNGTAFVVRVEKIAPSHTPEFSTIRSKVLEAWQHQQRLVAAKELAQKLIEAKNPDEFHKLASQSMLKAQNLKPVNRLDMEKDKTLQTQFGQALWQNMFTLKLNEAAYGETKDRFVVAMLTKIQPKPVKTDSKEYQEFIEGMNKLVLNDLESSLIQALKNTYKVKLNESMLHLAIGQGH